MLSWWHTVQPTQAQSAAAGRAAGGGSSGGGQAEGAEPRVPARVSLLALGLLLVVEANGWRELSKLLLAVVYRLGGTAAWYGRGTGSTGSPSSPTAAVRAAGRARSSGRPRVSRALAEAARSAQQERAAAMAAAAQEAAAAAAAAASGSVSLAAQPSGRPFCSPAAAAAAAAVEAALAGRKGEPQLSGGLLSGGQPSVPELGTPSCSAWDAGAGRGGAGNLSGISLPLSSADTVGGSTTLLGAGGAFEGGEGGQGEGAAEKAAQALSRLQLPGEAAEEEGGAGGDIYYI